MIVKAMQQKKKSIIAHAFNSFDDNYVPHTVDTRQIVESVSVDNSISFNNAFALILLKIQMEHLMESSKL